MTDWREMVRADMAARMKATVKRRKPKPKTSRKITRTSREESMAEPIATIQQTPTRRVSVSTVELAGFPRVALYEEERTGQRWAQTNHGFTLDPEQVPELIEALQRCVSK